MINKVCTVIPVHKSELSICELNSLIQCRKIIKEDVFLVYPDNMNPSVYLTNFPEINLCPVSKDWLNSIIAYNKMKRSIEFYELFSVYDYLLTYELDSYIFSNNWDAANTFEYDYIGAPWFDNYLKALPDDKIMGVGNSGFSMRNVKKCIETLKAIESLKLLWRYFSFFKLYKIFKFGFLANKINKNFKRNSVNKNYINLFSHSHINEDIFWSNAVAYNFKIAEISDAIKFSFEANPAKLYRMNNNQLPLGCHGWEKYKLEFWEKYIEIISIK